MRHLLPEWTACTSSRAAGYPLRKLTDQGRPSVAERDPLAIQGLHVAKASNSQASAAAGW